MSPSDYAKGFVIFDSTIVKETTFTITWSQYSYVPNTGNWFYEIQTGTHSEIVTILVTSKAADEAVAPFVVDSSLSTTNVDTGTPIVINAKVGDSFES
ncbi:unnamed protein product [Clavelina lepadiformis]|uniref:Uncharacterized protein n=1 Tax=Clavelina lepadiformis TaxID=159417 RepID=A0ABP0GD17_CLALP